MKISQKHRDCFCVAILSCCLSRQSSLAGSTRVDSCLFSGVGFLHPLHSMEEEPARSSALILLVFSSSFFGRPCARTRFLKTPFRQHVPEPTVWVSLSRSRISMGRQVRLRDRRGGAFGTRDRAHVAETRGRQGCEGKLHVGACAGFVSAKLPIQAQGCVICLLSPVTPTRRPHPRQKRPRRSRQGSRTRSPRT